MSWQGITPTPDPGFMRKLKTFDPALDCEFNREIEKFIITQPSRLKSGRLVAAIVENPGKDFYRQPDDRDLRVLAKADFERKDHKRRIKEGEDYILSEHEKSDKRAEEAILAQTKDNGRWLKRKLAHAAGLVGDRVDPAFRRITPKSKGYVVKDRRTVQ